MTTKHQTRLAKVLAILTFAFVVGLSIVAVIQLPKVISAKDAADLQGCRSQYLGRIFTAQAGLTGLQVRGQLAGYNHDTAQVKELVAEAGPALRRLDAATTEYARIIVASRKRPDAFLEHCRQ